eukprot:170651-Prymnesium_polylepis.1
MEPSRAHDEKDTATQQQPGCEPWCKEPCEQLNGDTAVECYGCVEPVVSRGGLPGTRVHIFPSQPHSAKEHPKQCMSLGSLSARARFFLR